MRFEVAEAIYAGDAGFFKICSRCDEIKPIDEFGLDRKRPNGHTCECKPCKRLAGAAHYALNRERILAGHRERRAGDRDALLSKEAARRASDPEAFRDANRRHYHKNRDDILARGRLRYAANKEAISARVADYRRNNPDKSAEITRKWRAENPDKMLAIKLRWLEKNPERAKELQRNAANKIRSTVKGKLENSIRGGVKRGIKGGSKAGRSTFELLGYTVDDLRTHLERQFQPGMTWDNYGRNGWHVDHRVPLAAFNYETPDCPEFKAAWSITNLQPLWEPENHKKKDKRLLLV